MKREIIVSAMIGTLLAGGSVAAAPSQAADQPSNPNILAAVQQVQATLDSLISGLGSFASSVQTALTNIQTTLNSVQTNVSSLSGAASTNILVTPPAILDNASGVACQAVNVSSTAKHVQAELVRGKFPLHTLINQSLDPGESTAGSVFPGTASVFYCRFTVSDGTKNDIRAALQVFPSSGAVDGPIVAAQ